MEGLWSAPESVWEDYGRHARSQAQGGLIPRAALLAAEMIRKCPSSYSPKRRMRHAYDVMYVVKDHLGLEPGVEYCYAQKTHNEDL